MKKIDAVILAGDRKGSILVEQDNKAFLKIKSIPSIVYVVSALLRSEHTDAIVVVGPASRLESVLKEHELFESGRVKIIEQRESLIENGKAGFVASLREVPDDTDFHSLDREKYGDTSCLVTSCDNPLITPHEIDEFILKSDMDSCDYEIGLCTDKVLAHYYPDAEQPGIRLTYFHLKEGRFRINNMSIVKPLRIERLKYIERMYEIRYQKRILNLAKLILQVLFGGRAILRIIGYALRMRLALYMFGRGHANFYLRLKESVRIGRVCEGIGKILGARFFYVTTSYGGAAIDIDHPEDKQVIEQMYEKWMTYQGSISPEMHPPT